MNNTTSVCALLRVRYPTLAGNWLLRNMRVPVGRGRPSLSDRHFLVAPSSDSVYDYDYVDYALGVGLWVFSHRHEPTWP